VAGGGAIMNDHGIAQAGYAQMSLAAARGGGSGSDAVGCGQIFKDYE